MYKESYFYYNLRIMPAYFICLYQVNQTQLDIIPDLYHHVGYISIHMFNLIISIFINWVAFNVIIQHGLILICRYKEYDWRGNNYDHRHVQFHLIWETLLINGSQFEQKFLFYESWNLENGLNNFSQSFITI